MLAKELAEILMKNPEAVVLVRIDDGDYGHHEKELCTFDIEQEMKVKSYTGQYFNCSMEGEKVPTITFS